MYIGESIYKPLVCKYGEYHLAYLYKKSKNLEIEESSFFLKKRKKRKEMKFYRCGSNSLCLSKSLKADGTTPV